jgi:hypothetical protein
MTMCLPILTLAPLVNGVGEFNTGFAVAGFDIGAGHKAGYRFNQAQAAGASTAAFAFFIEIENDGTIDWQTSPFAMGNNFGIGDAITFFYQSSLPPLSGRYNLAAGANVGETGNLAPGTHAPLPGAILMLGSGLGVGIIKKRLCG